MIVSVTMKTIYKMITKKYIRTEYDIGLSEGRNRQVEQCETEYLIIFDDDFLVVENSNLEMLYNIITENKALDMVGGVKMDEGEAPDPFKGKLEVIDGSVCKHINKTIGSIREYKLYDFIPNFFITKTSILKEFKWDSRMKVAPEHLDFFLTHKNKFLITYTESVMVYHHKSWATTDKDYKKLRMRRDYYNVFYEKHNVSRIRERHEA